MNVRPYGMLATLGVMFTLWGINPVATFWTVCAPFLVASTAMMIGNWWGTHPFTIPFTVIPLTFPFSRSQIRS